MARGTITSWECSRETQDSKRGLIFAFDFQGAISCDRDCDFKIIEALMRAPIEPDLYDLITSQPQKLAADLIPYLRGKRRGNVAAATSEMRDMGDYLTRVKYKIHPGFHDFVLVLKKTARFTNRFLISSLPLSVFHSIQNTLNIRPLFMKNYILRKHGEDPLYPIKCKENCLRKYIIYFAGEELNAKRADALGYTVILVDPDKIYPAWKGPRLESYEGWDIHRFRKFLDDVLELE